MISKDIAIIWMDGKGDIRLDNDDLLIDDTLTNAVIISLLTDRVVDSAELDGQKNQGWWGDAYSDQPWGSRLWLLQRQKSTDDVVASAVDYAQEALAWLKQDQSINEIVINGSRQSLRQDAVKDVLVLDIYIELKTGSTAQRTLKMEFSHAL